MFKTNLKNNLKMKTNLLKSLILFFTSINTAHSQEVLKNLTSSKEYFFIGGLQSDSIKVLSNGSLLWINNKTLTQTNKLPTKDFIKKIFNNNLFFEANGDEPFWRATITKNKLIFNNSNSKKTTYDIQINANTSDIDGSFYFMFNDKNGKAFGIIRGLGFYPKDQKKCDLCLTEEATLYEVFIKVENSIYKGCASLKK